MSREGLGRISCSRASKLFEPGRYVRVVDMSRDRP
jgi:hypothetical protein